MNIFLYELKAYRKSTLVWTFSLLAIVTMFMSFYPSISKDIDQFTKLLEGFPEPVRKAFGLQLDNMGTIMGFYSYMFLYLTLCGAIQGMNLGISVLSKETRDKTADFLLTKPVTRVNILTAKLMATAVSLILTNAVYMIGAGMMASQVKTEDYSMKIFVMISLTLLFIQLIFLVLGLLLSVLFARIKSVLTVSLGVVFCFFFIGMLAATGGDEAKRFLSPFKYFDTAYIIEHSSYEAPYLLAGIGIIAASLITSYIAYMKKDIHAG
ncbi:ABC transporter permease subunit [Paenibacillus harenae]|uniref:ABC transporter permease subunit n=1 Tax=Paenibacillus harenae TaxID=306543 RepID=UPI000419DA2D|nr:ABC transporter permease subunit [Paenibacillus harenae]